MTEKHKFAVYIVCEGDDYKDAKMKLNAELSGCDFKEYNISTGLKIP